MSMFITWNIYYFNILSFIFPLNSPPLFLSQKTEAVWLKLKVICSMF